MGDVPIRHKPGVAAVAVRAVDAVVRNYQKRGLRICLVLAYFRNLSGCYLGVCGVFWGSGLLDTRFSGLLTADHLAEESRSLCSEVTSQIT